MSYPIPLHNWTRYEYKVQSTLDHLWRDTFRELNRLAFSAIFVFWSTSSSFAVDLGGEPKISSTFSDLKKWANSSSEVPKEGINPLYIDAKTGQQFYFFKQFPFSGIPGARFFAYQVVEGRALQVLRLERVGNKTIAAEWHIDKNGRVKIQTPEGHVLAVFDFGFDSSE